MNETIVTFSLMVVAAYFSVLILRGLAGSNIVGADIVEVAPPFDHAEITSIAAAHVAYELLALFALRRR